MSEVRVYGGWSKERAGRFFGLTGPALVGCVAMGLPEVLALGSQRWALLALWAPVWAVAVLLIAVPVHGRPAARWLLDWVLTKAGSTLRFTAFQSLAAGGVMDDPSAVDLPGVASGIRVYDGPPFGEAMSRPVLVADENSSTWRAVASYINPGLGLAGVSQRQRRGEGLSELMEAAARAELVEWIACQVRTIPDDGAERRDYQQTHRRDDAPAVTLAIDAELSRTVSVAGVRAEVFVTVVVAESAIRGSAKQSGGGIDGRARVMQSVMREVQERLISGMAGTSVTWLDSAGLAQAIRTGYAPGDRAGVVRAKADPEQAGVPMAAAGPSRTLAPQPRSYTHDAWTSVSCAVLLPDGGAVMGALAPVFAPATAGERRSVTVFYSPMPAGASHRAVGRDSMAAETGSEMRRKAGFTVRARNRKESGQLRTQDEKLARGRALVRVSAIAATTVPSEWTAAEHGENLQASIRAAGFTPLMLDLAQDSGFVAACLPLGIGFTRLRRTP
ncbi:MAG: SCO6880 family protein [Jatrophihabitantaceae bacterium]